MVAVLLNTGCIQGSPVYLYYCVILVCSVSVFHYSVDHERRKDDICCQWEYARRGEGTTGCLKLLKNESKKKTHSSLDEFDEGQNNMT